MRVNWCTAVVVTIPRGSVSTHLIFAHINDGHPPTYFFIPALQCQVLDLLTQLVQLRVNYCLLDSDQIFINFVLKQFEFVQEGQIPTLDLSDPALSSTNLVPHIFQFLVLLSYEKYHSKSIITMARIIQLC